MDFQLIVLILAPTSVLNYGLYSSIVSLFLSEKFIILWLRETAFQDKDQRDDAIKREIDEVTINARGNIKKGAIKTTEK